MYAIVMFYDESVSIIPKNHLYDMVHAGIKWECRTYAQAERVLVDYCKYVVIEDNDGVATPVKSDCINQYRCAHILKGFSSPEKASKYAENFNKKAKK